MVGDLYSKQLLRFAFTGSRGGETRARIIREIMKKSFNTNQLAHILELDYKSVSHHLSVLEKSNIIKRVGEGYGVTYCISTFLAVNFEIFEEMVEVYDTREHRDKQFEKPIVTIESEEEGKKSTTTPLPAINTFFIKRRIPFILR